MDQWNGLRRDASRKLGLVEGTDVWTATTVEVAPDHVP